MSKMYDKIITIVCILIIKYITHENSLKKVSRTLAKVMIITLKSFENNWLENSSEVLNTISSDNIVGE